MRKMNSLAKTINRILLVFFLFCLVVTNGYTSNGEYDDLIAETIALANQGDAQAQFSLAMMYDEGNLIAGDRQQAILWLTRSAQQNLPAACLYLGMKYAFGNSVKQDIQKAEKLYGQAARQGWAMAQYLLAILYLDNEKERDKQILAAAWLQLASKQHYPGAAEKLQEIVQMLNAGEGDQLSEMYNHLVGQIEITTDVEKIRRE